MATGTTRGGSSPDALAKLAQELQGYARDCKAVQQEFVNQANAVKPFVDRCNRLVRATATGDDRRMVDQIDGAVKRASQGASHMGAAAAELLRRAAEAEAQAQQVRQSEQGGRR